MNHTALACLLALPGTNHLRSEMRGFFACATVASMSMAVDADLLWADVCTQDDVKGEKWCDMSAPVQVHTGHLPNPSNLLVLVAMDMDTPLTPHPLPPTCWCTSNYHGHSAHSRAFAKTG